MNDVLREFINEKLENDRLSVVNLKGGAAVEMFDYALQDVMDNIADINTKLKTKRSVILKLDIIPHDEDRTMIDFALDVQVKLAGRDPVVGMADVKVDGSKGPYAKQRRSQEQENINFNKVTPIQKAR